MRSVVTNFFYQSIFQLTKIIIPIITIPIVSRALGPDGIGVYNYTYSITQYFILVAGLGISLYGSREIAMVRKDKNVLSKTFWEIVSLKVFISLISIVAFLGITYFMDDRIYFYFQIFSLFAVLFDISWFFMGIEDFKKTSVSNLISQMLVFVAIITLIRRKEDIHLYIFIQSVGSLLPQIFTWMLLKGHVHFVKINFQESLQRIKTALEYFIPQVSITIYTNVNKTLLGLFVGTIAVGYYSNALTLNTVFITLITTLDTVMLPKMSRLFSENNINKILENLKKAMHLQLFFSIAIMFGMLTVYDKLVPWFFGSDFLFLNNLIPFFSILIVVIPTGMAISRQYLLPIGNTKDYNISVAIGAAINIVMNIFLIQILGIYGVVIANITAEFFVTFSRLRSLYLKTSFRLNTKLILKYLFSGSVMCLATRAITSNFFPNVITNIIQLIIGVGIYFALTILLKVNLLWNYVMEQRK